MNQPVNKNPPGMLNQGEQMEEKGCLFYSCWIFQIIVWILIGLVIYFIIINHKAKIVVLIACIFSYLIYLILEFCSPTCQYLCNKSSTEGIYEKMGNYFKSLPKIQFTCECYHYEIKGENQISGYGITASTPNKEKVVTYDETYDFPYYSERDVSGLFYLNCNEKYINKKHFIKLQLKDEINFADSISYMDYQNQKELFWKRNRPKDNYMDFTEKRFIQDLIEHNLVKISEEDPFSINWGLFFLLTILTFSEFYKLYFDSFCVFQRFKIRKIVSTRYDLNKPAYKNFTPQINIIKKQYSYTEQYYCYVNNSYQVQLPTKEELERARQYQNKVPDYRISSGNGNIKDGVIVDNPTYANYEENSPPPAFELNPGNIPYNRANIYINNNQLLNMKANISKPGEQLNIITSNEYDKLGSGQIIQTTGQ